MPSDLEYPKKLSQALNDLRKQNQLCDITINIGGRAFHAHKAVLAACSSYFLAMFTSGFKESTANEISIDGKVEIFEILLQFAYTGELKITSKTVYDVIKMSCYMQFTDVYPMCCNFIQKRLQTKSTSNRIPIGDVFGISQLARNYDCLKQLVEEAYKYMEFYVQELKGADEFLLNASVEFLKEFLSRENLASAKEEQQVFDMVVSWLKYDWENRRSHTLQLLTKVRLGLVPTKNLKELLDTEILEVPGCKVVIDGVLQLQSSKKPLSTLSWKHPKIFATRSMVTVPITSVPGTNVCEFKYYQAGAREYCWKSLRKMDCLPPEVCKYHSLIVVKRKLYAVGGIFNFRTPVNTPVCANGFFCYSAENNKWVRLPSMNKARHSFPLVYLDGFMYAIAGSNQRKGGLISDVERYDMAKKEWQVLPSLPDGYHWVSAVAYRGKILVYGVSDVEVYSDDSQRRCERVIQVYHPDTNVWQTALSEEQETPTIQLPVLYDATIVQIGLPLLFIHNDVCYRVLHHTTEGTESKSCSVNILAFQSQNNETTVTVGEKVNQDLIPNNGVGAFQVCKEVFVREKGFVYKTDLAIAPDQTVKVNLNSWEHFKCTDFQHTNITYFTFDRKKLK